MDVHFFLRQRIAFIRQLYDITSAPYVECKRKIEAGEEPFVPPYSEDGEPPFLNSTKYVVLIFMSTAAYGLTTYLGITSAFRPWKNTSGKQWWDRLFR